MEISKKNLLLWHIGHGFEKCWCLYPFNTNTHFSVRHTTVVTKITRQLKAIVLFSILNVNIASGHLNQPCATRLSKRQYINWRGGEKVYWLPGALELLMHLAFLAVLYESCPGPAVSLSTSVHNQHTHTKRAQPLDINRSKL